MHANKSKFCVNTLHVSSQTQIKMQTVKSLKGCLGEKLDDLGYSNDKKKSMEEIMDMMDFNTLKKCSTKDTAKRMRRWVTD